MKTALSSIDLDARVATFTFAGGGPAGRADPPLQAMSAMLDRATTIGAEERWPACMSSLPEHRQAVGASWRRWLSDGCLWAQPYPGRVTASTFAARDAADQCVARRKFLESSTS